MKKALALLLALLMLSSLALTAAAESTATEVSYELYRVNLNKYNDTLYGRETRDSGYALFDLFGYALTEPIYSDISYNEYGFIVRSGDDVNNRGFLDDFGSELVPCMYGDVDPISAKWQVGIVVTEATSDNYDYKYYVNSEYKFYLTDHADVYFCGTKVGTLNRNEYDGNARAYGDYLYNRDRDGKYHYFNSELVESSYDSSNSYSEYDSKYSNGKYTYYHAGSNQQAFCPECTLTPDEVQNSVVYSKDQLLDLQGNVVASLNYDYVYGFSGEYARVKTKDGSMGMINTKGEEIVPCMYEDVDYSGPSCGYLSVVKDGKQGFVSLEDGTETGFVYPENAVSVYSPFSYVQDLDGSYIVMAAGAGVLSGRYADVDTVYGGECPIIVLQDMEGKVGVVGVKGDIVIPFTDRYDDTYDLTVSKDGTVIEANDGVLYHIDYDFDAVPELVEAPAEGSWNCPECGRLNDPDFNFCPIDGLQKP